MTITLEQHTIDLVLSVVRLGDLDRNGWWRSHGLDETGSFLLQRSFKRTWAATAMELSMVSARARHDDTLGRKDAVHLFSDELPFYRLVHSWLLEQKLDAVVIESPPYFHPIQAADAVARSPNGPTGRQIASVNQPEAKVKSDPKSVKSPEVDSQKGDVIGIAAPDRQHVHVQSDCLISEPG